MKKLILLLLTLSLFSEIFAKCSDRSLSFYPKQATLTPKSLILVEGFRKSRWLVKNFNQFHPIYLQSKTDKIKLDLVHINYSQYGLTQALLQAQSNLKVGQRYEVVIEGIGKEDIASLSSWNIKTNRSEPQSWKVIKEERKEAVSWLSQPKFIKVIRIAYGCGDAVYALFEARVTYPDNAIIHTQLRERNETISQNYMLSIEGKGIKVGHGMCAGAYDLKKGRQYQIRFKLQDLSIEKKHTWTPWIEFTVPKRHKVLHL